jgi:hypothetical protein
MLPLGNYQIILQLQTYQKQTITNNKIMGKDLYCIVCEERIMDRTDIAYHEFEPCSCWSPQNGKLGGIAPHPPPCGGRGGTLNIGPAGDEDAEAGVGEVDNIDASPAEIGGGGGVDGEGEPELREGAAGLFRPSCFPPARLASSTASAPQ